MVQPTVFLLMQMNGAAVKAFCKWHRNQDPLNKQLFSCLFEAIMTKNGAEASGTVIDKIHELEAYIVNGIEQCASLYLQTAEIFSANQKT